MPIEIGGLGLLPPTIGATMGMYGAGCGIFQALFFARAVRYFGERNVFILGVFSFIPIFLMFPIINLLAKQHGLSLFVWVLVAILLSMLTVMDMAYGASHSALTPKSNLPNRVRLGCIFMYITASAPNKRSLGATNGLSQTTVSIARAIGPALSTSLFSWSVEKNILGGYGVYVILIFVSFFSLALASRLPAEVWEENESAEHENDD